MSQLQDLNYHKRAHQHTITLNSNQQKQLAIDWFYNDHSKQIKIKNLRNAADLNDIYEFIEF